MKLILRILLTAILVMLISHLMKGVSVDNFITSLIVAIVLGLLNIFIKPILVLLTLPVTIFKVDSLWTAMLFSILLSLLQSIMYRLVGEDN